MPRVRPSVTRLVAHRGQSADLPENTLEALRRAIACGATAVEFDLQLTVDRVPVLCHDLTLQRTSGVAITLSQTTYSELQQYSVGEAARLGAGFAGVRLPTLQQAVALLQEAPQVTAFVELKQESIDAFGAECLVQQVATQLQPLAGRCVVIADSLDALLLYRQRHGGPIGWIVHRWAEGDRALARQHAIDYLVIHQKHCLQRAHDFAADPWAWMVYQTSDPNLASALFAQGIVLVESNDICAMLASEPQWGMPG